MKKIVEIRLIVDESKAESARAEMFLGAKEWGYDVLCSDTREMTKTEVKDAQIMGLIE